MAEKKKTSQTAKRSPSAARKPKKNTKTSRNAKKSPTGVSFFVVPLVMIILAVVTVICLAGGKNAGAVGEWYGKILLGLFSVSSYLLPVYFTMFGIFYRRLAEDDIIGREVGLICVDQLLFAMLSHVFFGGEHTLDAKILFEAGIDRRGGGLIGSLPGELLWRGLNICMPIILIGALVILIPLTLGFTPHSIITSIGALINGRREDAADRREERSRLAAEERLRAERQAGIVRSGKYPKGTNDMPIPMDIEIGEDRPAKRKTRNIDIEDDPASKLTDEEKPAKKRTKDAKDTKSHKLPGSDRIDLFDENDTPAEDVSPDPEAYDVPPESYESDIPADADDPEGEFDNLDEYIPGTDDGSPEEESATVLNDVFGESEDDALLRSLHEMYGDPDSADGEVELDIKRRKVTVVPSSYTENATDNADEAESEAEADAYVLPPVDLLTDDPGRHDPNIAREVAENARKLTDALKEFNVNATVQNTAHGPTVTRYELTLQSGTRVRTIANLSDDISLSLAAPGSIRIEAPIPGKSAVGIEVPNQSRDTVYLRSLIDDAAFAKDARLWVALGADVAGAGVYFDIAKMPHLLIAGATGMGKSVCINCLIMSLLYRAKPDEVKLILVDPKRVEFKPYEGLPHLLVPVVSDPKKAAGALSWAVSEMERRFGLIEEVGARDIAGYNRAASKSAEAREILPHIVIIIDELADLMMTAKDAVESSICRIAQKARAAGMHLVIGTQRPSVDVITGLIKSNIPSRISCTVSSQIDSRTIIDRAGAERLLGKGDMLFNPVGAQKPLRVQGAFVSDEEVEAVVEFIKNQSVPETAASNSDEVMAQIEREAARCDTGKKGGASSLASPDDGEDDPMLPDALQLAVESGKISTSLIQRRLSLGYGRAAKIIDRMEQLGYVGAPDGQRPREVLITAEQFLEMKLKRDE